MEKNTIEINGETYIRRSSITSGKWTCFIVQQGWVIVGIISEESECMYNIKEPHNVRTYGSGTGIEGIVTGEGRKIDSFGADEIELPKSQCIFKYSLPSDWTNDNEK